MSSCVDMQLFKKTMKTLELFLLPFPILWILTGLSFDISLTDKFSHNPDHLQLRQK